MNVVRAVIQSLCNASPDGIQISSLYCLGEASGMLTLKARSISSNQAQLSLVRVGQDSLVISIYLTKQ